ncbi:uncharacterized protein [Callorhinus ursinus]|uniref:uncharacterized protein n=1 Tax=Callorhinus ursinus TaxID=34884 RepID=UPI003CD0492D
MGIYPAPSEDGPNEGCHVGNMSCAQRIGHQCPETSGSGLTDDEIMDITQEAVSFKAYLTLRLLFNCWSLKSNSKCICQLMDALALSGCGGINLESQLENIIGILFNQLNETVKDSDPHSAQNHSLALKAFYILKTPSPSQQAVSRLLACLLPLECSPVKVSLPKLITLACQPNNTLAFVLLSKTATNMALKARFLGQVPHLSSFHLSPTQFISPQKLLTHLVITLRRA